MIDIGSFFDNQTDDCIVKTMKNRNSWDNDSSTVCTIHAIISLDSTSGLNNNGDEQSLSSDAEIFFDNVDIKYEPNMSSSDIAIGCIVYILGIEYEITSVDVRGILPVSGATCSITARRIR